MEDFSTKLVKRLTNLVESAMLNVDRSLEPTKNYYVRRKSDVATHTVVFICRGGDTACLWVVSYPLLVNLGCDGDCHLRVREENQQQIFLFPPAFDVGDDGNWRNLS